MRFIVFAGIFTAFALPGLVFAQDAQWLRYRSSRHANDILGAGSQPFRNVSHDKPEGLELPEFKTDRPGFVRWESPMAAGGGLWIALDRRSEGGVHQYDSVWIDSNGDGSLKDESPTAAWSTDEYYAHVGPVGVVFQTEDGPVTYHLNFRIYQSGERTLFRIAMGCWYEGRIQVDGQSLHCTLIDQNVNGRFNDNSPEAHRCDLIRIGEGAVQETRYVGRYIEIGGKLYSQEVAADGAFIKLTPASDVKYGTVEVPSAISGLTVGGENGLFVVELENGAARLPAGSYRVQEWRIDRKDEKGDAWRLTGTSARAQLNVPEDGTVSLDVGEPVLADLTARSREADWQFNHEMKGRGGEQIRITRRGSMADAPQVQIRNRSGTYDQTFKLEYG